MIQAPRIAALSAPLAPPNTPPAGQSYIYDKWNWLDGNIAALSVLDVAAGEAITISWIRMLRLLRVLRPLRLVSRVPELRVVVEALVASVPNVGSILVVAFIFFLTFGILGVSLFSGTFFYCQGSDEDGITCAPPATTPAPTSILQQPPGGRPDPHEVLKTLEGLPNPPGRVTRDPPFRAPNPRPGNAHCCVRALFGRAQLIPRTSSHTSEVALALCACPETSADRAARPKTQEGGLPAAGPHLGPAREELRQRRARDVDALPDLRRPRLERGDVHGG